MIDSVELFANNIRRHKPPKVQQCQDETNKRRQTITIPSDVAGALANHSATRCGFRVGIQRELSMNLPPLSAGKREVESELAQAFSKFRRHASEIAQSHQVAASTKPNSKACGQQKNEAFVQDVQKPSKSGHSKQFTSQKSTAVSSQLNKDGVSQPCPAWKSMSSLASDDEQDIQKPLLMMASQTFQSMQVRLASDAKANSASLAVPTSDSHCSVGKQENATCDGEVGYSAEREKCYLNNLMPRNTDEEVSVLEQHTSNSSATELAGRRTSGRDASPFGQLGDVSSTRLPLKTRNLSMNSERTATVVAKPKPTSNAASKPELSTSITTEAASFDVSAVTVTSQVDTAEEPAAGRRTFARQKSCPGKPEQTANSMAAQLLCRSLDAVDNGSADIPHALEQLRSSAEWKTDESGNKTDIKLKKSHSITFKPRKNPTPAIANQGITSVNSDKHSASAVDSIPSVNHNVSLFTKMEEASTQTKISDSQSIRVQVADQLPSGIMQHIQSLKTSKVVAAKKVSSPVALTGSLCENRPGEPIWLTLARQKTQRWTEGAV